AQLRPHQEPIWIERDLNDTRAPVAPYTGERQGQPGLENAGIDWPAFAEMDPIVDLMRHRLGKFWVLRIVGPARDHVHGESREPQLLLARRIEPRKLDDGWHLAKEPQHVEAQLLGSHRMIYRPADLALDLPDELADYGGCVLGLHAQDAVQQGPHSV